MVGTNALTDRALEAGPGKDGVPERSRVYGRKGSKGVSSSRTLRTCICALIHGERSPTAGYRVQSEHVEQQTVVFRTGVPSVFCLTRIDAYEAME